MYSRIIESDKNSAKINYPEIFDFYDNPETEKAIKIFQEEIEDLPEEYKEYFSENYSFDNDNLADCWTAIIPTEKGEIAVFSDGELTCSNPLYIIELTPEEMSEKGLRAYIESEYEINYEFTVNPSKKCFKKFDINNFKVVAEISDAETKFDSSLIYKDIELIKIIYSTSSLKNSHCEIFYIDAEPYEMNVRIDYHEEVIFTVDSLEDIVSWNPDEANYGNFLSNIYISDQFDGCVLYEDDGDSEYYYYSSIEECIQNNIQVHHYAYKAIWCKHEEHKKFIKEMFDEEDTLFWGEINDDEIDYENKFIEIIRHQSLPEPSPAYYFPGIALSRDNKLYWTIRNNYNVAPYESIKLELIICSKEDAEILKNWLLEKNRAWTNEISSLIKKIKKEEAEKNNPIDF